MDGIPARQNIEHMRRKKYKRKPFKPIDREQFREVRMMNRLTIEETAKLLQVTSRTIAHWESGVTRIPYTAFKLLRCLANGELLPQAWKGWVIKGDTLWSPVGRSFRQHELAYLTNYMSMARYWQADYAKRSGQRQPIPPQSEKPLLYLVTGGER